MIQEIEKVLFENNQIKIKEIQSLGVASAPNFFYKQQDDEYVLIKKGIATLEIEGKLVDLKEGDHLLIKKNISHRVNFTSQDCIWYCIFIKK
jgi:cupin 2 domain-containing protein